MELLRPINNFYLGSFGLSSARQFFPSIDTILGNFSSFFYYYKDSRLGGNICLVVAFDAVCGIISEYRGNDAEDKKGALFMSGGVLTTLIKYELVDIVGKAQWKASVKYYTSELSGLETSVNFAETKLDAAIGAVDLAWFSIAQKGAAKCS